MRNCVQSAHSFSGNAVSIYVISNKPLLIKLFSAWFISVAAKIPHKMNFLTKTVPAIPTPVQYIPPMWFTSVVIIHKEAVSVCHTVEAYAKVESASQSSQAVPHCASLKLLNALLILMLPWLHRVNPAFVSLWMDSRASLFQHVCLRASIWNPLPSPRGRNRECGLSQQMSLLFQRDLYCETITKWQPEARVLPYKLYFNIPPTPFFFINSLLEGRYCVSKACVFKNTDTQWNCPLEQQRLRRTANSGLQCQNKTVYVTDYSRNRWLCPEKASYWS